MNDDDKPCPIEKAERDAEEAAARQIMGIQDTPSWLEEPEDDDWD